MGSRTNGQHSRLRAPIIPEGSSDPHKGAVLVAVPTVL